MKNITKYGFSIIELSVILIVIGLLIAVISSGRHLLEASKSQQIFTEFTEIKTSINQFLGKYKELPGDLSYAEDLWGDTEVDNGDGNARIEGNLTEKLAAWQHLSKAKLIRGVYSGADAGTPDFAIDVNVRGSEAIKNDTYYILGYDSVYDDTRFGNAIQLTSTEDDNDPRGAAVDPETAVMIDKKFDIGQGPVGEDITVLRSDNAKSTVGKCVNNNYATSDNAEYVLDDFTASCRVFLWID